MKGASLVRANLRTDSAAVHELWKIDAEGNHVWTQNEELHIVEGDTIGLPVSLSDNKLPLRRSMLSFVRCVDGKIIENLHDRVKFEESAGKLYHNMRLEALEQGEYNLRLSVGKERRVKITVHKGEYWRQSGTSKEFILKNNCLLSSATSEDCVRIESV